MNQYLLIGLGLWLTACGSKNNQEGEIVKQPKHHPDTLSIAYTQAPEDTEKIPEAMEIKTLQPGKVVLPSPFVDDSALRLFFPGKYTAVEPIGMGADGLINVVWWKCAACKTEPYYYKYFTEPEEQGTFPAGFNTSVSLGNEPFDLDGQSWLLYCFYHTDEMYPDFTGRFMGAPTGAALFRKKGKNWVMENFQALLGCFGTFRGPFFPQIIRAGRNNILLDFTYANGGPGAEYTSVKEIFMPAKGSFKSVLLERFLYCSNTDLGDWSSTMVPADSMQTNGWSDLVITTTGFVNAELVSEEDNFHYFDSAPVELRKKVKAAIGKKEKVSFSVVRTFRYNGRAYACVESKTDFS